MTFLPGFDWTVPGQDSGRFVAAPLRLVLHTTEGASAAGAIGAFRSTGSWPHFTVDPVAKVKYQHIPLDLAARALVHTGAVETNREGAIQIEMVGFAAQTPGWDDSALRWLATEVFAPILAATDIPTAHPAFIGADGHPAGVNAKQRFTDAQWAAFAGICGHQHVPSGNDHWDPGGFPIDRCLAFLAPASTKSQEDDMTFITTPETPSKRIILFTAGRLVHVGRIAGIDQDQNMWDLSGDPDTWGNLVKAFGPVVG